MSEDNTTNDDQEGVFEYLVSGPATARMLDFFVAYKDFDYSETDIANLSGVSPKTAIKEIQKFEKLGLIRFTRNVGRAKMYRLDPTSPTAKALQQFAFVVAEKDIENMDPMQEKLETIETGNDSLVQENNTK